MVEAGELLEHDAHLGASYGTPRAPVEEQLPAASRCCSRSTCRERARCGGRWPTRGWCSCAPPSFEELARRLVGRGTEDPAKVRVRLDRARIELAAEDEFDEVVVNDDLERAADRLLALMGVH